MVSDKFAKHVLQYRMNLLLIKTHLIGVAMSQVSLEERFVEFLNTEKYRMQISAIPILNSMRVDFMDIINFDPELAKALTDDFRNAMKAMKAAALEILSILRPVEAEQITEDKFYIELVGDVIGYQLGLRNVSSDYIWKLVTISGLLIKVSQVYSIPMKLVLEYNGERGFIERKWPTDPMPKYIEIGGKRVHISSCRVVREGSEFIDIQYARIQEPPDEIPPGEIPSFIDIILMRPLINRVSPGDVVRVSGFLDVRRVPDRREERYEFRLIANSIRSERRTEVGVDLTEKDIEEIVEESRKEGFYKKVLKSIAPSIYGYEIIKEALLLSIIGGVDKELPDGTRRRGRIHMLLVGDPGVAKSQLLKYAARIAPKGLYVSGRGSTAAGLTAAVIKEPGGGMSLEAGAVALADMGVCAIDEIDKMRPEDRVALHEAMEQMTISISKGGIVATLNARTTIIAAANPVDGVYNPFKPVLKNIDMPITLISRFDIIHLMRDEPGSSRDERLVDHIISSMDHESDIYCDTYSDEFLRKYIAYARTIKPKFSREAWDALKRVFINLRKSVAKEEDTLNRLPITPRELEAMIRLAEASARAHLRDIVTEEDAKIAINQVMASMSVAALDTTTGEVDAAILATGVPSRKASLKNAIMDVIRNLMRESGEECAKLTDIISEVMKVVNVSEEKVREEIEKMHRSGYIIEKKTDCYAVAVRDYF